LIWITQEECPKIKLLRFFMLVKLTLMSLKPRILLMRLMLMEEEK
jgi:hypothetical protein